MPTTTRKRVSIPARNKPASKEETLLTETRRLIQSKIERATVSECEEVVGLLKLTRSGFWQNSFVAQLVCDYGRGERTTPQQVFLLLADCIEAIESTEPGSALARRLAGERISFKRAFPNA